MRRARRDSRAVITVWDNGSGFAPDAGERLKVVWAPGTADKLPENKLAALAAVLARDPRPQYQHDPERLYAMDFAGYTLRFTVEGERLTVREAEPMDRGE